MGWLLCLLGLAGCRKYLDAKTDKTLVQPATLADAQALLDDYTQMNTFYPSIAAESEDDHFLLPAAFSALNTGLQNNYTWAGNAFLRPAMSPGSSCTAISSRPMCPWKLWPG